jgi:hypothetical protein
MKRNTNKVRSDPEHCSISVKAVSIAAPPCDMLFLLLIIFRKLTSHTFILIQPSCVHHAVVMRCASRYDDVGPLRYHQHPLFFQTMEPLQLAQIEDNSPVSRCSVSMFITVLNRSSLSWIENMCRCDLDGSHWSSWLYIPYYTGQSDLEDGDEP